MAYIILTFIVFLAVVLIVLRVWRWADYRADMALWARLASRQPFAPDTFDPSMIGDLPDPAQRYFRFAIKPGTPLFTVAEISMAGQFSLGDKSKPNYMPMRAEQILAAPHGFVWRLRAGKLVSIAGSDAAEDGLSWSRFWLLGCLPVARIGGTRDHARAAFGRYVAEAVFWTPAALLPSAQVRWESINDTTARVTLQHGDLEQAVDLSVDSLGKLTKIMFQRWTDANPAKRYQLQPFGGYLSEYKEFAGFRLPTVIEAGNFFETGEYFPFFRVTVSAIRFSESVK